MEVQPFLVKADRYCDYVPILSTATNFIDLFQKCVVLPFLNQSTIESNHYFKHLQQKSFLRCVLLMIPVLGNILVGIYDCSHQKTVTYSNKPITLNDVEQIIVKAACAESSPCQHSSAVLLKDGRKASARDSYNIQSIVSSLANEKIKSDYWSADQVKKHFQIFSKPNPASGWKPESAEVVLNRIFNRTDQLANAS